MVLSSCMRECCLNVEPEVASLDLVSNKIGDTNNPLSSHANPNTAMGEASENEKLSDNNFESEHGSENCEIENQLFNETYVKTPSNRFSLQRRVSPLLAEARRGSGKSEECEPTECRYVRECREKNQRLNQLKEMVEVLHAENEWLRQKVGVLEEAIEQLSCTVAGAVNGSPPFSPGDRKSGSQAGGRQREKASSNLITRFSPKISPNRQLRQSIQEIDSEVDRISQHRQQQSGVRNASLICAQQGLSTPAETSYIQYLHNIGLGNSDNGVLMQTESPFLFQNNNPSSQYCPITPYQSTLSQLDESPCPAAAASTTRDGAKSVSFVDSALVRTIGRVNAQVCHMDYVTPLRPVRSLRTRCVGCGRPGRANCICGITDNRLAQMKGYKDAVRLPAPK